MHHLISAESTIHSHVPTHAGPDTGSLAHWLARWRAGDRSALESLVPVVYNELRQVARRQLSRESPITRCRRRRSCTKPTCACCASITCRSWIARACWPWPASRCAASSSTTRDRAPDRSAEATRVRSRSVGRRAGIARRGAGRRSTGHRRRARSVGGARRSCPPCRRVPRVRRLDPAGDRRRARHLVQVGPADVDGGARVAAQGNPPVAHVHFRRCPSRSPIEPAHTIVNSCRSPRRPT